MITGVRLCGRGLVTETNLTFFAKQSQRISVVFGRNGSGKTTVSEAFARFSAEQQIEVERDQQDDLTSVLLTGGTKEMLAPNQVKLETLVFNEKFIEENVRIRHDGLRSLVMFGKSGQTQEDLDAAIASRDEIAAIHEKQTTACNSAEVDTARVGTLISDALRKGWADREREVKQNKNNSRVNQATVEKFLDLPLSGASLEEVRMRFEDARAQLARSRGGEEIINSTPRLAHDDLLTKFESDIFMKVIEAPSGVGLSKLVAHALEHHGSLVQEATHVFREQKSTHCPLCQQTVSSSHRAALLQAIKDAVDEPATEFLKELDARLVAPLRIDLGKELTSLDEKLSEIVRLRTHELNSEIQRWNQTIETKKTRLYSPYPEDFTNVPAMIRELDSALTSIETKRLSWNDDVKNVRRMEKDALGLNDQLARIELEGLIDRHRAAIAKLSTERKLRTTLASTLNKKIEEVRELSRALRSEDVAAEEINHGIATVFADPNRLRIVVDDAQHGEGRFRLQSRGRNLKPHRLSVGERNVLSLCYFFTLLRQCMTEGLNLNRTLLVLDDPISSVDIDNRVGILSFLEIQLGTFLSEASSANALLLTHDVSIFQDLGKTSKAIVEKLPPPPQGDWTVIPWILRNTGTENTIQVRLTAHTGSFDEPLHEYKTLMNFIYNYALDDDALEHSDLEAISIGNALRRVFEAFGVFIYGQKSITSSTIVNAYQALDRGALALPIRQALVSVMHGGSHQKDRMMSLGDFGMGVAVEEGEQVVVARKVLALMTALQPIHMQYYLSKESKTMLETWITDYL